MSEEIEVTDAETVTEKLESAVDHQERATELREEAREEAEELVRDQMEFDAVVSAEYHVEANSVVVKVMPEGVPDQLLESEDVGQITPLTIFFGESLESGPAERQRDRIRSVKDLVGKMERQYDEGAPVDEILKKSVLVGLRPSKVEEEIEKLRRKGEVYEPKQNHLRTT